MVLAGKNVVLRAPTEADLPYIRSLWADPDTMKEVGGPIEVDDEKGQRWFEKMVDPGNPLDRYFLICDKNGQPLGEASFHRYDPATKAAELNIKIQARHRYRGHGPEALRLLLDYFFNEFGGEEMSDPVRLENRNGRKAIRSAGFEHDPSRTDVFMLRMARKRFRALSEQAKGGFKA